MELRREVRAFAELMETQLRKHDEKRGNVGWKDGSPSYIASRMFEEMGEAIGELHPDDKIAKYLAEKLSEHYEEDSFYFVQPKYPDRLCKELADMANLAMMLADVTHGGFCDDDKEAKIECAMDREQWNDILNLRGVVIGSVGQKALMDLGRSLDASWNPDQWPASVDK